VDLLNAIGAQVVLMPAEQSEGPPDALSLPEPVPEISAEMLGGGWGGLDMEAAAPQPGAYALDVAGGLEDLDVPTRPQSVSRPRATAAARESRPQRRPSPGAYHERDVRDSLFAPGDAGAGSAADPTASLIEHNAVPQTRVRSHETVSAPFADMIERHTVDDLEAPVADLMGGCELDMDHAEPAPPPMGDDLLDVDAPSADFFGGDVEGGGEVARDEDFDDGPTNLSPAVAAALRMPVRGTRRSGRRIARDAKPVDERVAAAVRARALAEQQIDAGMEGVVMSQPPPLDPAAAGGPPPPPAPPAQAGSPDLGLGDVPPLPSLPPLPPPPTKPAATTAAGSRMPPLPGAGANPLPPPPAKKNFTHREIEQDASTGLPALNLGTQGGSSQPLPDPSSDAAGGGGGGYWSAKRGARKDETPAPRRAPSKQASTAAATRADATSPSLELDDEASAGKFQRQHAEVPDTTSAPVRAIGLIGGALCVLVGGLLLDNTILFGNATPLSLAAHAFFFYGLGAGLAELKTE
jgi:hypothetical protein